MHKMEKMTDQHIGVLQERHNWLEQRIIAKRNVGWDIEYDTRERNALCAVLNHLKHDESPRQLTAASVTLETLSEFMHNRVGEASTLFVANKDLVFNEERALKIAQELIDATEKLVREARDAS